MKKFLQAKNSLALPGGRAQFVLGRIQRGVNSGQPSIRRVAWCGAAEPMLSKYGKDQRLLHVASQLLLK